MKEKHRIGCDGIVYAHTVFSKDRGVYLPILRCKCGLHSKLGKGVFVNTAAATRAANKMFHQHVEKTAMAAHGALPTVTLSE